MSEDIPKGFIVINEGRLAVSEIESYRNDESNGRYCVMLRTKSGIVHREMGITTFTIDDRIIAAQEEST